MSVFSVNIFNNSCDPHQNESSSEEATNDSQIHELFTFTKVTNVRKEELLQSNPNPLMRQNISTFN